MIIGIDVDGVLADFNPAYIDLIIDVHGEDLFPSRPFAIPTWDYPEFYGYSTEVMHEVWKEIAQPELDFFRGLVAYPGAEKFIEELNNQDNVYYITTRPGVCAKVQTEQWLLEHGANNPTVLISKEKQHVCRGLKVDTFLDDKASTCAMVVPYVPYTFMLEQTWNYEVAGVQRVKTLTEFLKKGVHRDARV